MKSRFKNLLSRLAVLLAVLMLGTIVLPACKDKDKDTPDSGASYTITVVSMGGLPLSGVGVSLQKGSEVAATRTTNSDGVALFNVEKGNYDVQFSNLPAGYTAATGSYKVTASQSKVTFNIPSKVIELGPNDKIPDKTYYVTGSVMYDFTVTTPPTYGSKVISLADLINTGNKKAVLINFWGSQCSNCDREFPVMEKVYQNYKDKISILALDNYNFYGDDESDVVEWQSRLNLTFDMAMDTPNVAGLFGINAYPTSIMIDRYGVVADITVGAVVQEQEWVQLFEKFTSDDYVPDISNPGTGVDDSIIFIPDKPADFNVHMSPSAEINSLISPTLNATYTEEADENSWPWEISGDSIVPTNRRDGDTYHRLTYAIITASFRMEENDVITFDYKCESNDGDTLQVVVTRDGMGKNVFTASGVDEDFKTKYAYVAIESGMYSVSFVYYKDYTADTTNDCVYIKNLRLEKAQNITEPLDVSYFAARGYSGVDGTYSVHDEYYLDDDGFYRVTGHKNSDGSDPYLLADFNRATPYNRRKSIYEQYIEPNDCVFGGVNYYRQLSNYHNIAGNSEISGLVPVDSELLSVLRAITKDELGTFDNDNSWTEFCSFYVHYGDGESMSNPIAGISYKTAFKATEQNVAHYDRFLRPMGLVYEYTAPKSGVYAIQSTYTLEQGTTGQLEATGTLYSEAAIKANGYHLNAEHIVHSGDDQFIREGGEYNFHIYEYLQRGHTYYIVVSPASMDTVGVDIPFEIKYLDETYEMLQVATSGMYTLDDDNHTVLPTYCEPVLGADGKYYTENGEGIYIDFVYVTRMFNNFTVEELLTDYFYNETYIRVDENGNILYGSDGKPLTVQQTTHYKTEQDEYFDVPNEKTPTRIRTYPFSFKYEGKDYDYTETFRKYYDMRDTDKNSLTYGMVQVDETLKQAITNFYTWQTNGSWSDKEWMKACYFIRSITSANAV